MITANDDFATPKRSNVPRLLTMSPAPLFVGAQEAQTHRYSALVTARWVAGQVTSTPATAGVAVIWDWQQARPRGPMHHRPLLRPSEVRGVRIRPRGITWQLLDLAGTLVVAASTHRPPPRYDFLWPAFDARLADWVAGRRHPVILTMDANTVRRGELARRLGMTQAGRDVNGIFVTAPLRVSGARRLPTGSSDHHPVSAWVTLP